MSKTLKSYARFISESFRAIFDGFIYLNSSLDKLNVQLELHNRKQSIRMAASYSKLNCVIIKIIPSDFDLQSSDAVNTLQRLCNYFEECVYICEKVENSDKLTDLVLSSSDLSSWFLGMHKIEYSIPDYERYLNNLVKSRKLIKPSSNPETNFVIDNGKIHFDISNEIFFINYVFRGYISESFDYDDLNLEIDKLFQEKETINRLIIG